MKLPIVRMTLYKHGVGFFERRGKVDAEAVDLAFRAAEMNDILKSLAAIDWAGGQVLEIEYPTPKSRDERLAGCSIRLADDRSLRDLLVCLRGRRVKLVLDQQEELDGLLIGLDELPERQPLSTSLVSVLGDGSDQVLTYPLARLLGIRLLDARGAGDLRFFLEVALAQEETRAVRIRLTPGSHDLSVSYVAPAPTWRVSYRLVADRATRGPERALLQAWGILDNCLEEDLEGIELSLVAGMPVSFTYELYTPFTPERPVIQEEARVAPGPVEFAEAKAMADELAVAGLGAAPELSLPLAARGARMAAGRPAQALTREALQQAAAPAVSGRELGELFQYVIGTPVSVRRGHSVMVPIVSAETEGRKELLYNGSKLPHHPVATLRVQNGTGLTLERGPVTVLEDGKYVGEAVLPFTVPEAEMAIPYAVELACKVYEEMGAGREVRALHIRGLYLLIEEWEVRWREYRVRNSAAKAHKILVEHPRTVQYDLFDTREPVERTDEHVRFEIDVPARGEAKLRVQERRILSRREELRGQSAETLQLYLRRGLLSEATHAQLVELLRLWERMAEIDKKLQQVDQQRKTIYAAQQQIQGNMGALSTSGKEGALRTRYVEQLEASEDSLQALGKEDASLRAELERLRSEADQRLRTMGG